MCGIAVTIEAKHGDEERNAVELTEEMVARLSHRGPDGASIFRIPQEDGVVGPCVILGHIRLAVVDEMAVFPFVWKNGERRTALIHNGEIYNHLELKNILLKAKDCNQADFLSNCDSEVLLACCVHRGLKWTLNHAKGMFAFVLVEWLENKSPVVERVVLARDTLGIKPLCYAVDSSNCRIICASEIQAIPRDCGLDPSCMEVKDVLPGTFVDITFLSDDNKDFLTCKDDRKIEIQNTNWSLTLKTNVFESYGLVQKPLRPRSEDDHARYALCENSGLEMIQANLIQAVQRQIPPPMSTRSAVLLSGGLDSSLITTIAARLAQMKQPSHNIDHCLQTFNISFHDTTDPKRPDNLLCDGDKLNARYLATFLKNVQHTEVTFTAEDGLLVLPNVIQHLETYDAVSIRAGVPLYLLSKHISSQGYKVVLCGEGADEIMAGYRLFEQYHPSSATDREDFSKELYRRLINIDTSELQRVDRCTSAHGLEARVPFLDLDFLECAMKFNVLDKMSHPSLGRIQKYILRRAFDEGVCSSKLCSELGPWLPPSILYREKEQFADGIGRGWVRAVQIHAMKEEGISSEECAESMFYKRLFYGSKCSIHLELTVRTQLVEDRQARRRTSTKRKIEAGKSQQCRWYPISHDPDLKHILTKTEAHTFVSSILRWPSAEVQLIKPMLPTLNRLIVSMLEFVPFHNLTLLTRPRRTPTIEEIKNDMMSGLGGPCSVVNSFFAALLNTLGFGPNIYLLSCQILDRVGCHVGILVQIKGLRYFVDVANAKPYCEAMHLGDTSTKRSLNGTFEWNLSFNSITGRMELMHSGNTALSFDPNSSEKFSSFRRMIKQSRTDPSFGPFLTGLRFCLYPSNVSKIAAVRDATIYEGESIRNKRHASTHQDIKQFVSSHFSHIIGFESLVQRALDTLDREQPNWTLYTATKARNK